MLSGASKFARSSTPFLARNFATATHSSICIIGGGCGGVNTAAQLIRGGVYRNQIRIFEPSKYHHYQPGWTMIGGGLVNPKDMIRYNEKMIPSAVPWSDLAVTRIDPENNSLETEDGKRYTYDHLIISSGIQNDYDAVKGLSEALSDPSSPVGTIYNSKYAQKWSRIRENFDGKNAVFTHPPVPFKCAGAPQKIMHLSHDFWHNKKKISPEVSYYTATPAIFSQPDYAKQLQQLADQKGIPVNLQHNLVEVRAKDRVAVFKDLQSQRNVEVQYDALHVTPPQKPQDFVKEAKSLVNEAGYVDVHPNTLQSTRYNNVWALGDCSNLPTSKTAAAIMEQTPVLVHNVLRSVKGKESEGPMASYYGYTSCPIFVGGDKLLLAEFKYELKKDETFGFLQKNPQKLFFLFKKYLFPFAYFNLMPRGLWYGRHGVIKPSLPTSAADAVNA